MSKIKIYKNNPTEGETDGDLVSSGTGLAPIESGAIKVPAEGYKEGDDIKLALRCDAGFKTILDGGHHATLTMENTTHVDKWALAPDDAGVPGIYEAFGDPLYIDSEVGDVNTIFWTKARVQAGEEPQNDESVDIQVAAVIGAE